MSHFAGLTRIMRQAAFRSRKTEASAFPLCVKSAFTALFLAVCVCGEARAGAWPMPPGEGQAIATVTVDVADTAFDAQGEESLSADFLKREIALFLEHGLTRAWTLVARPAYQQVSIGRESAEEEETGFAAFEIGARRVLFDRDAFVASAQMLAILPGEGENVLDAPLGAGGGGAEARLLFGRGFDGWGEGGFVEAQTGYRWRAGEDADEARLDLTVGWRPSRRWTGLVQGFSAWSMAEPPALRPYDHHRLQLSAVRRINERWSFQIGGFRTVAGRNVIAEQAGFISLWRRY